MNLSPAALSLELPLQRGAQGIEPFRGSRMGTMLSQSFSQYSDSVACAHAHDGTPFV